MACGCCSSHACALLCARAARPRARRSPAHPAPRTPSIPENPDDLSEEELEALQQQMDEDYEIAIALKESVVPRAVEWYTGEAAPPLYDGEYDDEDEGYEDDDEEEPAPRRR